MLCLGLADKRAASSLLPASTQAEDPGGEKAGPGLEERWCFISQIINYDDSFPPPLLPSAYITLPSFPTPGAEEAGHRLTSIPLWEQVFPMPSFPMLFSWTEAQ